MATAKSAAAKTAAKAKQNTVSLKHIAANLAENHELPKKQTEAMLNDVVALVTKHLKKGDRIRLAGLGVLVVRKRAARMGRRLVRFGVPGQADLTGILPGGKRLEIETKSDTGRAATAARAAR